MVKKARLGLYLEDEEIKREIKMAAASHGISTTAYCQRAIREQLKRDSKLSDEEVKRRAELAARMDKLRAKTGPIGISAAELIREGRRR